MKKTCPFPEPRGMPGSRARCRGWPGSLGSDTSSSVVGCDRSDPSCSNSSYSPVRGRPEPWDSAQTVLQADP